jgi:hypothetical protein
VSAALACSVSESELSAPLTCSVGETELVDVINTPSQS